MLTVNSVILRGICFSPGSIFEIYETDKTIMKYKTFSKVKIASAKFTFFLISFFFTACNKNDEPVLQTNNWQTIYQNNDLNLFSITFLDNDHGFVMAETDTVHGLSDFRFVLSTDDGGTTWNQQDSQVMV